MINPPCSECAFLKGTEANLSEWTSLKAKLCLMARDEFSCHLGDKPPCAGYLEALQHQPDIAEWKRDIAADLLAVMVTYEQHPEWREQLSAVFPEILLALMEERKAAENGPVTA